MCLEMCETSARFQSYDTILRGVTTFWIERGRGLMKNWHKGETLWKIYTKTDFGH